MAAWSKIITIVFIAAAVAEAIAWASLPSWKVEASETSSATPDQIWIWYADSSRTQNWDYLISKRTVDGPFAVGTHGSNTSVGGQTFPWTYTDVRQGRGYTEVTRLPLATLTATHEVTSTALGTDVSHALIVSGPLAWLYHLVMYRDFKAGIHDALHRLTSGAATGPPPVIAPPH